MSAPRFASIVDYLAAQDPVKAGTLRAIIAFILGEFPELASKISWNVPTIHRDSKYVAGVCAYRRHLTFSAWSPKIIEAFQPRLSGYVVFKNCFQLPVDWTIDQALLKDLILARLTELNEEAATAPAKKMPPQSRRGDAKEKT